MRATVLLSVTVVFLAFAQATITVTKPTASSIWRPGCPVSIEWTSSDDVRPSSYLRIVATRSDGQKLTLDPFHPNSGTFAYTVESDESIYASSSSYTYRVEVVYDGIDEVKGVSAPFSVRSGSCGSSDGTSTTTTTTTTTASTGASSTTGASSGNTTSGVTSGDATTTGSPSAVILAPVAGYKWEINTEATVLWDADALETERVRIDLFKGTDFVTNLGFNTNLPNDGEEVLELSLSVANFGFGFRIKIASPDDINVFAYGPEFYVEAKVITSPSSGSLWTPGTSVTITWREEFFDDSTVYIDLVGRNTYRLSTDNDGSLTMYLDPSLGPASNGYFIIYDAQSSSRSPPITFEQPVVPETETPIDEEESGGALAVPSIAFGVCAALAAAL